MASASGRTSDEVAAGPPSPEKARAPVPATVTGCGPVGVGIDSQVKTSAMPTRSAVATAPEIIAKAKRRGRRADDLLRADDLGTADPDPGSRGDSAATQLAI